MFKGYNAWMLFWLNLSIEKLPKLIESIEKEVNS